jgi:hypothetical protein
MLALATSLTMLFAARIVDGLSGGNITTPAPILPISRRREPREGVRPARRGIWARLHRGPRPGRGAVAYQLQPHQSGRPP